MKNRGQLVGACGSDMNAIPIVLLNGDRFLIGARRSDMKAIPTVLLNGDQLVVGVCGQIQKPFLLVRSAMTGLWSTRAGQI